MTEHRQTQTWVAAARVGDRLALAKLLALHHPRLMARAAGRMDADIRARTSPEDVLQEVYLQVFRQIDHFEARNPDSFLNWVITILDRKLIDARRAARRARRDVGREASAAAVRPSASHWDLLEHVYRDTGTPSRVVRHDEAVGALLACIAELLDSHRRVIELRFLEGLPVAEVAQELGKSEEAVVALTQRALKSLRESMDRLGTLTQDT